MSYTNKLLIAFIAALIVVLMIVSCSFKEVVMRRDMFQVIGIDTLTHAGNEVKMYHWMDSEHGLMITTYERMNFQLKVGDTAYVFIRQ